uniref:RNase III domain-containing protein n=1 Tax=Macrostomum lignano TaxID=282301 RepID=A0A1I8JBS0_9PLAT
GEANLLVVTEAMENLGDLPKCNLVVRFNPPRTFNSYFHSKNRARSFNSTYATLVTPCDAGFQESHAAFKATEELLLRSGAASDESRRRLARGDDSPIADADDESSESETFAPFGLSGPSVTADAAIPVVNRYCARLPSDVFASLVPLWQIEKCRLCLPMNSPCRRSVIGAWCPTVQSAKCSAALACVRELHSAGQLDSNLKPYSKEELVNLAHKSIIQSPMSKLSNGDGVIGNSNTGIGGSKRRQVYQKQLAAELTANLPEPDLPCRLYRIRLRPEHVWAMPSAAVAAATDPEQLMTTSRCRSSFGLILRDPLPDYFPLIADSLTLSAEQLSLLKRFHRVLFHRVLRLEKEASMTPDFDEAPFKPLVCLLTRPVKEAGDDQNDEDTVNADDEASWQLDWDLAGRVVASAESQSGDAPPCEILPEKPFKFRVEDFNDCVIVPSYRNFDQPQFYFVSQIRWDLNPASPFPTSAYDSFEEYYLKKYNIRLTTRDQPLLDVEQSSSRYNSTGVGIDALNTISSGEKLAYCALINSSSVAAQQQGQATADDKNAKSAAPGGDADFGVFQCNSADNDEDPLLGEAGDGEDAESTDSFEEMVTFFPSVQLAVSLLPNSADLLQCLTASNAGDLMNLERLETVGDSLLKFAVTVSLYCTNPGLHEGGLTQLRSRQVSNSHLYLCAAAKGLGELIVANKFEPRENWLPPGLVLKHQQQQASKIADSKPAESPAAEAGASTSPSNSPGGQAPQKRNKKRSGARNRGKGKSAGSRGGGQLSGSRQQQQRLQGAGPASSSAASLSGIPGASANCTFLQMEQSLTDKCLADSVEAIVGCYLVRCNEQAALRVCRWFGIAVGELGGNTGDDVAWPTPPDPVLPSAVATSASIEAELARRLTGYDEFESLIGYRFRNRAYLLQAFTHPSDYRNDLTDCYQRLEFLGDAVLDYVVTRYLFHDSRRHSPAVLTDLRSALVNNDIFGALAVKWGFHKYFRCVSPALHSLIDQFVQFQKDDKADNLDFVTSEEADFDDRPEDVEIPKCLGDIFESVAGAVFLDSGMSLDTVWRVFYPLMKERIECYTAEIPKSLVRELLETEPDCTKFEQPTRTASGTIRVVVHVIGKGRFAGVGRNYRIARNSAAKVALRYIKAKEREKSAASADVEVET